MTITDLITLLQNKLSAVSHLKTAASSAGDVEQVLKLEQEEVATETLILQLKQVPAST
jgi:hypothetical protein